jgi:PAS domain S-box-containing protein
MWSLGAIVAVVLATVSGGVFWTSLRMEQARYDVEQSRSRSLEVIVSATALESSMIDRQRMARGLVISKGALDPFDSSEGQAERASQALSTMVATDSVQSRRVSELVDAVARQSQRIDEARTQMREGLGDAAIEAVVSGVGEESIARVRRLVSDIVSDERSNLIRSKGRSAEIEAETELYTYAIGLLGLLIIVVAGTAVMVSVSSSWKVRVGEMQRRLDDEAIAAAEMMRIAHEATGAGTWELSMSGPGSSAVRWSPEMHLLYGRDIRLGSPDRDEWRAMVHPDDLDVCPWTSASTIGGASFEMTFRIATPSGRWRHVVSRGFAFKSEGVARMVGMDVDVTEQIENRDELRRLNDLLSREAASDRRDREVVFESSGDLMALIESDGTILSANPAWGHSLGFDHSSLVGTRISSLLVPGGAWPGVGSFTAEMIASGDRRREIDWTVTETGDGRVVAAGRDVTAQREADARLRHAEEALRQMQKIETVGEMTGGIAHDFNNMLTPIVGFLDILRLRHADDPKSSRMINLAMQSSEKARTLVSKLLSFARRQQFEYRVVDASELVVGMQELVDKAVAGSGVVTTVSSEPGVACVKVDPNQFEMVVMNLAVNARDAMPQGGRLSISIERRDEGPDDMGRGRFVVVSVSDTGIGMTPEVLAKAVEPFYSTKGVGKGTGLGLSMAHGMAAQSGGVLTLESEVGVGTTARIWLPELDEGLLAPSVADVRVRTESLVSPMKVLLVDDDEIVRGSIREMLTGLGHEVVAAGSGAEAISLIATDDGFDMLVTDYLMPSMTGRVLIDRVREVHPDMPAVIVSGYTALQDRDEVVGTTRLSKPFTTMKLDDAMSRVSGKTSGKADNVVRIDRRAS